MKRAIITTVGIMAIVVAFLFVVHSIKRGAEISSSRSGPVVTTRPVAPPSTTSSGIKASTVAPTPTTSSSKPLPTCADLARTGTAALDAVEAENVTWDAQFQAERDYHNGGDYAAYLAAREAETAAQHAEMEASSAWDGLELKQNRLCPELVAAYTHVKDAEWRRVSQLGQNPGLDAALAEKAAARAEWDRLAAAA